MSARRVARLLREREAIDHELDDLLHEVEPSAAALDPVVPRWLSFLARWLPVRSRDILARDYAFRELAVARIRQAQLEAQNRKLAADLGVAALRGIEALPACTCFGRISRPSCPVHGNGTL